MTNGRVEQQIMDMLNDRQAKKWRREYGRTELAGQTHIPLGWVPVGDPFTPVLHSLISSCAVRVVDLPHRSGNGRAASFLVAR